MKKPKVVMNTYPGAFFIKGGGEIQLEKSAEALIRKGCEVVHFDMWNPQIDVDIVHHFTLLGGTELVLSHYKKLHKPICLSSILWPTSTEEEIRNKSYLQYILNFPDLILTNSHAESKLMAEFYQLPIEKFFKTRNGIDKGYLELSYSKQFMDQYNIQTPYVLTVANIDRRKNTLKTLEACEKLGLSLVSIGGIKDNEYYDECISKFDNLVHLGSISDQNILKSAYQNCEIFILASLFETPGLAALEAAAQGAKIVITEGGCTKEYFEDYVSYVDPYNVESIIEGIMAEKARIKNNLLRNHIVENYTWDHTADDLLDAYKKIKELKFAVGH